jgi:hypothetical protein
MKKDAAPSNRVFVLDAPEKFANRARPAFAKVIKTPGTTLVKLPQPRNEVALILKGAGGETVGGDQLALPFAIGIKSAYWLSAKLVLMPFQDKYALKSISLSVFRGEARAEKTALLRAEWDCPISSVNSHAQPHWHAYPEMLDSMPAESDFPVDFGAEPVIFELPKEVDDFRRAAVPKAEGFTRVHLAMAATWHLPKHPQDRVAMTSEAEVFAWIENCASYLKDQLTQLC